MWKEKLLAIDPNDKSVKEIEELEKSQGGRQPAPRK
jgi:hypothetical protein